MLEDEHFQLLKSSWRTAAKEWGFFHDTWNSKVAAIHFETLLSIPLKKKRSHKLDEKDYCLYKHLSTYQLRN
jgi:hypothetical protein